MKIRVTTTFDLDVKHLYKGTRMSPTQILSDMTNTLSNVEGLITHIPFAGYKCKVACVPPPAKPVVKKVAKKVAKKTATKSTLGTVKSQLEKYIGDIFAEPKPKKKVTKKAKK